jgi:hypothetical protein
MMFSLTKGDTMEPRIACRLQSRDYHKEHTGNLGLWKTTHRNFVPYYLILPLS